MRTVHSQTLTRPARWLITGASYGSRNGNCGAPVAANGATIVHDIAMALVDKGLGFLCRQANTAHVSATSLTRTSTPWWQKITAEGSFHQ